MSRFVKSVNMMADILTKTLPAQGMKELRAMFKLNIKQRVNEEKC